LSPSNDADDYITVKTDTNISYIGRDDDDDLILDYNDEDGNDYCWHRSMLKMKKKSIHKRDNTYHDSNDKKSSMS